MNGKKLLKVIFITIIGMKAPILLSRSVGTKIPVLDTPTLITVLNDGNE